MRDDALPIRIGGWVSLILGIWLIISPWVLQYAGVPQAIVNNIIVGALMVLMGAALATGFVSASFVVWGIAILGVWLIISSFVLGYTGETAAMINDIVIGIVALIYGAWRALAVPGPTRL